MNVEFGVKYPLDIIGEIPAWPRKSGNHGKKLLPTCVQNWTNNFFYTVFKDVRAQNVPTFRFFLNLPRRKVMIYLCQKGKKKGGSPCSFSRS